MSVLDLAKLSEGERVQHELMVRTREDKTTKSGDSYAVLQLGNASGQISANVWKEDLPSIGGVKPGSVVQVIGTVKSYQGRRQLELSAPPRVVSAGAVDLDAFLPRIAVEAAKLWDVVDKWRGEMRSRQLRAAVDTLFADDAFRSRFERAPAARRGRHAQIGGLLMHVVETGTIARAAAKAMRGDVDLVTAGALLHDIGKVEAYSIGAAGFDCTQAGSLVQHVTLGSLMLDRALRTLPAGTLGAEQEWELHHFIQSQHAVPEGGTSVRPVTLEAELLHWADQASANAGESVWQRPHEWK